MKKLTREQFIEKAKKVHGEKYSYSNVNYVNNHTHIIVNCPKHGDFTILPSNHLSGGGCYQCFLERITGNKDEFISKAIKIHGSKYDYSKVIYINGKKDVVITCQKHGDFKMKPTDHLQGQGCSKCGKEKISLLFRKDVNAFINEAKQIHGDKYDYSKVNYVNYRTPITIICPIHGDFQQPPAYHLDGCGCQLCKCSHMETEIRKLLTENNIEFEEQKKFEWLGNLRLDFYLPKYNIGIECQGLQHFIPIKHFGGKKRLEEDVVRDKRKKDLCINNGIQVLYYANYDYNFPYCVYNNTKELLSNILKT